jgi:hypothetical protein
MHTLLLLFFHIWIFNFHLHYHLEAKKSVEKKINAEIYIYQLDAAAKVINVIKLN